MPRFSKQVYVEVASVLAAETSVQRDYPKAVIAVQSIGYSLADVFARDNPRFDRATFYAAAGIRQVGS